jgi:hypothetical protein
MWKISEEEAENGLQHQLPLQCLSMSTHHESKSH